MCDTECPYCGADVEINHDDGYGYDESDMHQQECECGKTFAYFTEIHFTYRTHKADCLNGGEHDYRKTVTYPVEFSRMRCKTCGDEKPLPANDRVEERVPSHDGLFGNGSEVGADVADHAGHNAEVTVAEGVRVD